jgi:hypothetical protein
MNSFVNTTSDFAGTLTVSAVVRGHSLLSLSVTYSRSQAISAEEAVFATAGNKVQWSGGNSYGFMTANDISFGSDLLIKCQSFNQLQSKIGMVWHQ